ncbi:MAG: MarR family winged helix-turn-helix transcriptional regulator [Coriobacteriia bacterium]|nr:MarR family winged helix-turn-helix transcriptional regulator [Coriobacteriia bacterium]
MTQAQKTVAKMKKATDLAKLAFHKNGPKSFKNGVGAVVVALAGAENNTLTNRELIDVLGMGRKGVKSIVKKGVRAELLVMGEADEKKTYTVSLSEEGKKVAEKRMSSDAAVAEKVLAGLTEDELKALEAISDKIILNVKEMGIHGKKKVAYKHNHHCRKHAPKNCKKRH